jgi:cutinase
MSRSPLLQALGDCPGPSLLLFDAFDLALVVALAPPPLGQRGSELWLLQNHHSKRYVGMSGVSARQMAAGFLGVAVVTVWTLLSAAVIIPSATAAPCPDIEVVFARGTSEPPGVGGVGQAFVDSLRSQVGGRSVGVYAVDYPATNAFASSSAAGANDASAHVQNMAASCPNTRIVLGGYSQGAVVIDRITTAMPPEVANHVAAIAVFGNPNPSSRLSRALSAGPLPAISPLYVPKTIDLCVPGDLICSDGGTMAQHVLYVQTGMTNQAATFAAGRL